MSKRNAIAGMRFYERCTGSGKSIFLVLGDLTRRIVRFEKKRHGAEIVASGYPGRGVILRV
jgi:hypothetical protein